MNMNTYISHYLDLDDIEDTVKNAMQLDIIKNNKKKENNMNKNFEIIKGAGYTIEATTTKYGEGYMHLVQAGKRVARIPFMTNNRSAKKIVEELPTSRTGTHSDLAMKQLASVIVALNVVAI